LKSVLIIGGGLSGLIVSILLAKRGIQSIVIEKKNYPAHRVCGEYISNEVAPFLKKVELYPEAFDPPAISRFMLSAINGKSKILPLEMGGFGISRYAFDHFLYLRACELGVEFVLNTSVDNVQFLGNSFRVTTSVKEFEASFVIGSFGKRSNLDIRFGRDFIKKRSPYLGVKYHVKMDHPSDLIALHNFPGGYCGVSGVENKIVNVCYLVHRDKLRQYKSIPEMEQRILFRNPHLMDIFKNGDFLFDKPETINEISFEAKSPVENHMLMCGDAAGMITPLCGNGMAMAIHSAKITSERIIQGFQDSSYKRNDMEKDYDKAWRETFSRRLFMGRQIQKLFGSEIASDIAINIALHIKPLAMEIIRNTHGKTF
jgi:menaquinone-9 beta-reductase